MDTGWTRRSSSKQATFVLSRMVTNLVNEISPWTALIYILTQQIGLGLPDLGNITEVAFVHRYYSCRKGLLLLLFLLATVSKSQIPAWVSNWIGLGQTQNEKEGPCSPPKMVAGMSSRWVLSGRAARSCQPAYPAAGLVLVRGTHAGRCQRQGGL